MAISFAEQLAHLEIVVDEPPCAGGAGRDRVAESPRLWLLPWKKSGSISSRRTDAVGSEHRPQRGGRSFVA